MFEVRHILHWYRLANRLNKIAGPEIYHLLHYRYFPSIIFAKALRIMPNDPNDVYTNYPY